MKNVKKLILLLLSLVFVLGATSCSDNVFDTPIDPKTAEPGLYSTRGKKLNVYEYLKEEYVWKDIFELEPDRVYPLDNYLSPHAHDGTNYKFYVSAKVNVYIKAISMDIVGEATAPKGLSYYISSVGRYIYEDKELVLTSTPLTHTLTVGRLLKADDVITVTDNIPDDENTKLYKLRIEIDLEKSK